MQIGDTFPPLKFIQIISISFHLIKQIELLSEYYANAFSISTARKYSLMHV